MNRRWSRIRSSTQRVYHDLVILFSQFGNVKPLRAGSITQTSTSEQRERRKTKKKERPRGSLEEERKKINQTSDSVPASARGGSRTVEQRQLRNEQQLGKERREKDGPGQRREEGDGIEGCWARCRVSAGAARCGSGVQDRKASNARVLKGAGQ